MYRTWILAGALLLAAGPLAAQRGRHSSRDREDGPSRVDTTVTLSRDGTVDLTLISGDIRVTSWSRGEVKVHASIEEGALDFDASSSRVTLNVRGDHGDLGDATFEVQVPVGTRVIAHATSGDIKVEGVKAEVEARSVSGDVTVSGASGRTTIESISGGVHGDQINGNVRASSVSGDLELGSVAGDLEIETVSGEIKLDRVTSKYVKASTVSGEVSYDGTIDGTGRYDFKSHSGTITLLLPTSIDASLSIETFTGDIDSAFPMTLQPGDRSRRGKHFDFTIGSGGAHITAQTFSGDIELRKH